MSLSRTDKRRRRARWRSSKALALTAALLAALCLSWAADNLLDAGRLWLWPDPDNKMDALGRLQFGIAALIGATVFTMLTYMQRDAFVISRARVSHGASADKKKVLVLPLSPSNKEIPHIWTLRGLPDRLEQVCSSGGMCDKWNWQQPLRAIRHHLGPLTHVLVIGSSDSRKQFHTFRRLCDMLLPPGVDVQFFPESGNDVDLEDYDALQDLLNDAVDHAAELAGRREHDVCVDITGGTKTLSIASAIMTLNRRVVFGYVQTRPPHAVIIYDAEIDGLARSG